MNYKDLIKAATHRRQNKTVGKTLEAVLETITEHIKDGDKVVWTKFFTIETKVRKGRMVLNPSTREPMQVKDTKVATFKASKHFKKAIK